MTIEQKSRDYQRLIERTPPSFNVGEVVVAGDKGPCGGVNMALETTAEVLDIVGGRETVYANNPPVHNDLILEEFQQKGLVIEPDINKIPAFSIWILSAHGTDPSLVEEARRRNILVVNTECQLVTRVRNHARRIDREDEGVIVYFGTANHPEPQGIVKSVPEEKIIFIDMEEEIADVALPPGNIKVLNQTTLSTEEVSLKVEELRRTNPQADISGPVGICYATDNRQAALREGIFGDRRRPVDLLIVVGSKASHNSKELKNIGAKFLEPERSHLIDREDEIDPLWFTEDVRRVGVTSGASVLDKYTDRVLRWFKERGVQLRFLHGVERDLTFKKPSEEIDEVRRYIGSKYNSL